MKISTRFLGEEDTSLLINNNVSILSTLTDQGYLIYGRGVPAGQPQGISHQFEPGLIAGRQDRFRVKLYGFNRQFAVANPHDYRSFTGASGERSNLQTRRELLRNRIERVIAAHLDFGGQSLKNALPFVHNFRGFSVNRVRQHTKFTA